MKIIGINGSYRGEKGQTSAFLDLLFFGAEFAGAECETIHLARQKINHCLGCDVCHNQDHLFQCVQSAKDDVAELFRKISECDLVIYATPVYVFGISSLLKTFLERFYSTSDVYQMKVTKSGLFFHHVNELLCSKPFVSLICCDNLDARTPQNALDYFTVFSKFMDAKHVGNLTRNGLMLFGDVHEQNGNKSLPKTARVCDAFQQAGYELATQGFISGKTERRANQEILPIPLFGLLKRFKPFKHAMVYHSNEFMSFLRQS
jgi:multimeric flavodoxin WrbA